MSSKNVEPSFYILSSLGIPVYIDCETWSHLISFETSLNVEVFENNKKELVFSGKKIGEFTHRLLIGECVRR